MRIHRQDISYHPTITLLSLFSLWGSGHLIAQSNHYHLRGDKPLYSDCFDQNSPFFEATVDLREPDGPAHFRDNLVPRGIVLRLEAGVYACFDTELLRVAAIWLTKDDPLSRDGLAMRSYAAPLKKQSAGQKNLPKPLGKITAKTGLYPGWQKEAEPLSRTDPRSRGLDKKELGRGPLPSNQAQWLGIEDAGKTAILHYQIEGIEVREVFSVKKLKDELCVLRSIFIGKAFPQTMALVIADRNDQLVSVSTGGKSIITIAYPISGSTPYPINNHLQIPKKTPQRWSTSIQSNFTNGKTQGAYATDELTIPYPNPWQRRIRPYSIDFFTNGDAAIVTFDGDVYRLEGLHQTEEPVVWKRIAAGFNEPASLLVRNNKIYIFSRNGITKLVDHNQDGETDYYQLVSNRFLQSAETRDYPLSLTPWHDDSWIITKGGQQTDHPSPHSGRALLIQPDSEAKIWAHGLRNGFINYIPERNLLVASDQQGHWVPATPFHIVSNDSFLGFEPSRTVAQSQLNQPAALWFPHRVARSGIDIVWCSDHRSGSLYQTALYLDYTNPSVHKVFIPEDGTFTQTAAMPLRLKIETPILKGAINPRDGLPYLTGFQIWDSVAKRQEGLLRLRVVETDDQLPANATIFKEGILLNFRSKLEATEALNASNYQLSSWNYKRTAAYGSGHYKLDGSPGIDSHIIHRPLLSKDRKSLFLAVNQLTTAMQYELQIFLDNKWQQIYLTANSLTSSKIDELGFESTDFQELFSQPPAKRSITKQKQLVSISRGQQLSTQHGCLACHSTDGQNEGKSGPGWKGLYRSKRNLANGERFTADDEYLRQSILDPNKMVVPGYEGQDAAMPSYQGILSNADLESILLFIKALK